MTRALLKKREGELILAEGLLMRLKDLRECDVSAEIDKMGSGAE